jgi:hypothetical protein
MLLMKKLAFHPFLIALFPVISLWASNKDYVTASTVYRSLILAIIMAALLLFAVHLVTREWLKAGVITSLVLLAVFIYGHLYTVLGDVQLLSAIIRHRFLVPFISLLFGFFVLLVMRKEKIIQPAALVFTLMGLILVGLPSIQLFGHYVENNTTGYIPAKDNTLTSLNIQTDMPDIYYIILDGYGRQDILQELYKYDNSGFIQALENRGFYVADKSNANYMQTLWSLGSSLNMDYLDKFIDQNDGRLSMTYATGIINDSQLRRILGEYGYRVVAFESSFEDLSKADVFITPPEQKNLQAQSILPTNEFEGMLIDTTIGKVWLDAYIKNNGNAPSLFRMPYLKHRNEIIFTLTKLGNVAKLPGKKFVLAHVVSPHPPFVFSRNGDFVYPPRPYAISDGDSYQGGPEEYIRGYAEQIQYINKLTLMAIDEIVANSSEPPIIIIQGDHGPGAYLQWASVEKTNVTERAGILNAYYFPDGNYEYLYPSISPVNSFRAVLNTYFGTKMNLLPDSHYFSADYSDPPLFINVDDRLEQP